MRCPRRRTGTVARARPCGKPHARVACTGVVVEDYADMVIDSESVGRDWALVHRWAIALDDGRLIFADDEDLAAAD